jgi:multidrug efflux pump subunit AcrB
MRSEFAGRLADAFLTSKLTPLLLAGALALGIYTVVTMPSEEEPQIIVPLADIYLPMPGATPKEVENRLLIPMENVLSGIEGVEYVYSHAQMGFGLVTVRYEVGRDMEESLVRLYATMMKYADRMPPGFNMPLVKTVTIDDVPFFAATLSSVDYDHATLRTIADELRVELEGIPEVRDVAVIGGYAREIRIELSPDRMAAYSVDPLVIAQRLRGANVNVSAGDFTKDDQVVRVTAGPFLRSARDVESVVLDVRDGALIQISDVADVVDGSEEVSTYTFTGVPGEALDPMVTIAVSKRPGADATRLGQALESKIEVLHGRVVPQDVTMEITRNYGETAREKVSTLKAHLLLAILAVGIVVALAMGWRSAVIVMISVPITFALTLFVYQFFGYTLNRVTLFALIFVTGIVIDDSIIVAENMERHFAMRDRPLRAAARAAVDEVGNPTILATLTVIAAVLPMLFVSGLMGPYMSPFRQRRAGICPRGHTHLQGVPKDHGSPAPSPQLDVDDAGHRGRAAVGLDHHVLYAQRVGEDAPLRRQERDAGHHRYAREHTSRGDYGAGRRHGSVAGRCGGDLRYPDLLRYCGAPQLQRDDPSLLPASRLARGRHPSQPGRQVGARRPEP